MLSHRGESATLDGFATLLHILHKHRDDLVLPSNPDHRVSRAGVAHYFNDRILGNLDHDLSSIPRHDSERACGESIPVTLGYVQYIAHTR